MPSSRSCSHVRCGAGSNAGDANEVVALALAVPAPACERHLVCPRPDERAELELLEAGLLPELAAHGLLVGLPLVDASSGRQPHRVLRALEAHEQDPVVGIEDDGARGAADPPLRHRRALRSARNQRSRSSHGTAALAGEVDGSTKSAVPSIVRSWSPSSGATAERPGVRGLADEGEDARVIRRGDLLEPLGRAREVGLPQVAGAARRAPRGVRQADAEVEKLRRAPAARGREA